ncbi:hypothetical protein D3261_07425 [Halococcus sp. IIIV-5B]|nr:hypothetical protein D3261_07425 [Halococcus sp. IIIV-5B]
MSFCPMIGAVKQYFERHRQIVRVFWNVVRSVAEISDFSTVSMCISVIPDDNALVTGLRWVL